MLQVAVNSLQHIPSRASFSRCLHIARPCLQCKNLDNSVNNINHLPYKSYCTRSAISCSNSLQHIPSSFSRCAHVARPCPRYRNFDNSTNNMNLLPYKQCCAEVLHAVNSLIAKLASVTVPHDGIFFAQF